MRTAHPRTGPGPVGGPDALVKEDRPLDRAAARQAVAALIAALGVPAGGEVARRTPERVVAGLAELLDRPGFEFTTFPNTAEQHDLVLVRAIPFTSVCAHHLLPFSGVAHVGVLPGHRLVGLSKLARAVAWCAAGLQVQEELGQQVARFVEERMGARGVGVVLVAEHACMNRRGVRALGAETVTVAARGALADDPAARDEFLRLTGVAA
ncbi:GTP cyclohydrolase I [Actinomadura atramentaria]|uniref:GTP cyclohydrolase I n=1 Tax=Actinomadura atramentaria TaxID=1990 RepID=UPI00039B1493|nr:GTP cyclohydrolase I [Actinomadura atramentaria]